MNKKKFLINYLSRRSLCVVATVDPQGLPESAVMEFSQTKNLEIVFNTYTSTRKYTNLKNNPAVAIVIGWEDMSTVQYEGSAEELTGKELVKFKKNHFAKNPAFQKWENNPDCVYFCVTPAWIRYSDEMTTWEQVF